MIPNSFAFKNQWVIKTNTNDQTKKPQQPRTHKGGWTFFTITQLLWTLWCLLPFFCAKETILLHLPEYEGQQFLSNLHILSSYQYSL